MASSSTETGLSERDNSFITIVDANPDVVFLVGSKKSVITAHKLYLASASEVFKAMFSNIFANETKITVPDLEADAFTEILRYCYTLKATITEENMLGILYGAEKYMLPSLLTMGVEYVLKRINETNCLTIFNATFFLNCPKVEEQFMEHFQKNPWKFFKDTSFSQMPLPALRKLASLTTMNCSGSDMKFAMSWFVSNGYCESVKDADDKMLSLEGFKMDFFGVKQFLNMKRDGSFAMDIEIFQSKSTRIQMRKSQYVYGLGLCVGILNGSKEYESVKLKFSTSHGCVIRSFEPIERSVQQSQCFSIVDLMFEKPINLKGDVSIYFTFETSEPRAVIKIQKSTINQDILMRKVGPIGTTQKSHWKSEYSNFLNDEICGASNVSYTFYPKYETTCLAYLIYKA